MGKDLSITGILDEKGIRLNTECSIGKWFCVENDLHMGRG
jgi:hypothetical protein